MASKTKEEGNVSRLVQMSLMKANDAMQRGDKAEARKLFRSTHDLCIRADAPPPVHGLVVRGFCDLLRREVRDAAPCLVSRLACRLVGRLPSASAGLCAVVFHVSYACFDRL